MTDGPYQPESIHLESSLGYYLTKARNVLVERTDRAVAHLGLTTQQIFENPVDPRTSDYVNGRFG